MTKINSTSVKPAPLRLHGLWLGLGLLAVQLLLAVCFILIPISASFPLQDKIFHLVAHVLPAWWFFMLYRASFERRALLVLFLILAMVDEAGQGLTTYHTVDAWDAFANVAGVGLGLLLADSRLGGLLMRLDHFLASNLSDWRMDSSRLKPSGNCFKAGKASLSE
jgi:hypothetical protein